MRQKTLVILLLTALFTTSCASAVTAPAEKSEPTVTLIPSATHTFTPPPTATNIQPATPTPVSNAVYYMVVLDASARMKDPFDGTTKWDAARDAVDSILSGLDPASNFGLVLIGGSPATEGLDPCGEPSVVSIPFSARQKVSDQISHLQAAGGGSISAAFALAQNQFEGLPRDAIRVLIYVTGSSDACASQDGWKALETQLKFYAGAGADFHGEVIVLDENPNAALKAAIDRIGGISKNVNFHLTDNAALLKETGGNVIEAVREYIDHVVATRPTEAPLVSSFTLTPRTITPTYTPSITPTPTLTYTPTITLTPSITPTETITPTPSITLTPITPTITSTWTPTVTPSVTFTASPPFVKLLSVNYLTRGVGCQIDVQVQVTGSPANGSFHVRNAGTDPGGIVYSGMTLQVGTNWISSFNINNLLVLPGDQPQYYLHEIWFEYNGVQTNHLKDLICPGLILS